MDRRQFLQSALYTGLLYGAGGLPKFVNEASAMAAPLDDKTLINLFLSGGQDCRHFIVPAYDSNPDSFGYKYWAYRWRAHDLTSDPNTWQQRWENDFYHITVGGQNWNGVVDHANLNSGMTFGIWKQAGWLIDMFRAGNVALVCNAVGGQNRAHDLSSLQLNQGNILSTLNNGDRSGWGGRLARSIGRNAISLEYSPTQFSFGPVGNAPNYNPNAIDNRDLIAVQNSREMGLNEYDLSQDQFHRPQHKMARSLQNYYQGLRSESIAQAYEKFMDHEQKVREFGRLIRARLDAFGDEPDLIRALRYGIEINGQAVNPDGNGDPRRILRSSYNFGRQIRNLFDCAFVASDILNVGTISMEYGGWDSHGDQRQNANNPDLYDPGVGRGIESGIQDIFGGQFGNSPSNPNAFHGGFSAVWQTLEDAGRSSELQNVVLTIAGEFGRQIRDNGDAGTDHGKGNIMFIIGESVNGGIYGEMFPDSEVDKYDNQDLNTPDIDPRTEIDPMFAEVCNWASTNIGDEVFPRTAAGYSGEAPIIEVPGMFNNLMS